MTEAKWPDRLFKLWVASGFCCILMSLVAASLCPSIRSVDKGFRLVGEGAYTPRQKQALDEYDRWVIWLALIAKGSLGFGLLGVLIFFRRGCVVFIFAAAVIFLCHLTLLNAEWVDL